MLFKRRDNLEADDERGANDSKGSGRSDKREGAEKIEISPAAAEEMRKLDRQRKFMKKLYALSNKHVENLPMERQQSLLTFDPTTGATIDKSAGGEKAVPDPELPAQPPSNVQAPSPMPVSPMGVMSRNTVDAVNAPPPPPIEDTPTPLPSQREEVTLETMKAFVNEITGCAAFDLCRAPTDLEVPTLHKELEVCGQMAMQKPVNPPRRASPRRGIDRHSSTRRKRSEGPPPPPTISFVKRDSSLCRNFGALNDGTDEMKIPLQYNMERDASLMESIFVLTEFNDMNSMTSSIPTRKSHDL